MDYLLKIVKRNLRFNLFEHSRFFLFELFPSKFDRLPNCSPQIERQISRGSRISRRGRQPRRGRQLLRRLRFEKFVCQNERIWTHRGARRRRPPGSATANINIINIILVINFMLDSQPNVVGNSNRENLWY